MNIYFPHLMLSLLISMSFYSSSYADVYRWKDADGNTVYSDKKPSDSAQPEQPRSNVNYYAAPKKSDDQPQSTEALPPLVALEAVEEEASETEAGLTEVECQQSYKKSCDEVVNWKQHAKAECGDDPRCDDEDYLDRKYRPRSQEELITIANRAAIRNNRIDDQIDLFLKKKYSSYCEDQAEMYCQNQRISNCENKMELMCEDPRGLEDIFARYNNLSAVEKQAIIEKAKQIALSNNNSAVDFDKLISSLVDILISQALLGL